MKQKETIKKLSLMDYTRASLEISQLIEEEALENDGAIEEALALSSEQNSELFQDKALKAGYAALSIESEATFIDERIKELALRKKSLQNASKRLKDYIKFCMVATERKSIKSDMLNITVKNTAVWPEVVDAEKLPTEFFNSTLTFKGTAKQSFEFMKMIGNILKEDDFSTISVSEKIAPDKKRIREAMLAGKPVPGAVMPDFSNSITIK